MKVFLSTTYQPHEIEDKWYNFWLKKDFFRGNINPKRKPFVIVIPPPNVTGSLHMGHALNNTIQDVLIRYKRMQGYPSLWLPGTDHAGIATQNVVEKQLAKEGLNRYVLGRENFLKRVWKWKEEYGNTIINQLKKLGCSCDWSRIRFTMDEEYSSAVKEVFIRLYKKGLIYRGWRVINWCCRCQTALSDIEVEYKKEKGYLYYIKYFFKDENTYLHASIPHRQKSFITIATTRPETMLGDTAVAVHPEDKRYQKWIGKSLILPILHREIPLIADEYVDMEFGTGAVKVTPAHDAADFEIGKRHNLPQIMVIDAAAKMTEVAGPYKGMDRYECRKRLVSDLKEEGYLEDIKDYEYNLSFCARCHNVIEPLLSQQWFVNTKPLAESAIKEVREGRIKFVPERWASVYLDWMENIKDWCVSRQIWWGHQIPVWYCEKCQKEEEVKQKPEPKSENTKGIIVSKQKPDKCPNCGGKDLHQDEDVLDTWFSSALWPFATLGWPRDTEDLKYFYPTSVLSTARDIIHLWVARMIMMGLEFCKDIPFSTVYIHPTVLNPEGKRMSKSLGTGVDPLSLMEDYGTDALRLGLILLTAKGQDLRFSEDSLKVSRHFANKIWNAARFILMNLSDNFSAKELNSILGKETLLSMADKWIISRYQKTVKKVTDNINNYEFSAAAFAIYEFIWNEFCDWYIEIAKLDLYQNLDGERKEIVQNILIYILTNTLKLLHPFMPFLTEEIWQNLPRTDAEESIMVSSWPKFEENYINEEIEHDIKRIFEVIRCIRNLRAEKGVKKGAKIKIVMQMKEEDKDKIIIGKNYILALANLHHLEIAPLSPNKPSPALSSFYEDIEIYLPQIDDMDIEKEKERKRKELDKLNLEIERIERILSNPDFLNKAPQQIIAKTKNKKIDLEKKKEKMEKRIGN